ncbi:MAG: hypothetical protein M0T70_03060 [Geobacteraceae bacterium]|nr:hypothetical protein [Geobacteraceae bacterium]
MGDIKDKLEQLAADLPQSIKHNRAKKSSDICEAIPYILKLLEKGYSLYRITQFLQAEELSVSYSLIKNTVAKKLREMHGQKEHSENITVTSNGAPITCSDNTKVQVLAKVPSPTPVPKSPTQEKYPVPVSKLLKYLRPELPPELITRLSIIPSANVFKIRKFDINIKTEVAQFIEEVESQLREMEGGLNDQ